MYLKGLILCYVIFLVLSFTFGDCYDDCQSIQPKIFTKQLSKVALQNCYYTKTPYGFSIVDFISVTFFDYFYIPILFTVCVL